MPDERNTPSDYQRAARVVELKQLVGKLEPHLLEVLAMMRALVQDGLSAAQYGQFGGSTPDPTGNVAVIRGSQAEHDLKGMEEDIDAAWKALDRIDFRRRRYMSANNDDRNRLDPTEWCRIHLHLQLEQSHPRWKGDLCSLCYRYKESNGHEPTPTEVHYHHVHGRWPHKLWDPKARKAV